MGVYAREVFRLSNNAFNELTKEGSFNTNLPQYSVGIDSSDKNIQKHILCFCKNY
jgi:hypothetical protein